jgi:hypothetical protein
MINGKRIAEAMQERPAEKTLEKADHIEIRRSVLMSERGVESIIEYIPKSDGYTEYARDRGGRLV